MMKMINEIRMQNFNTFSSGVRSATVYYRTDCHAGVVTVLFRKSICGKWHFDYEKNCCMDRDERRDLEEWLIELYVNKNMAKV